VNDASESVYVPTCGESKTSRRRTRILLVRQEASPIREPLTGNGEHPLAYIPPHLAPEVRLSCGITLTTY